MDLDDLLLRLLDEADRAEAELRVSLAELLREAALQIQELRINVEVEDLRGLGQTEAA